MHSSGLGFWVKVLGVRGSLGLEPVHLLEVREPMLRGKQQTREPQYAPVLPKLPTPRKDHQTSSARPVACSKNERTTQGPEGL